jgi:putative PIG3 family NAD(P)H quinone oxidoreductase
MKAVRIGEGPEFTLHWAEAPSPIPKANEVRIRVHAIGVNRADLLQRQGLYPPPPGASEILGLECSGTIDAVGQGVSPSRIGERVCALLSGGGYAEYAVCNSEHAVSIPDQLSFEEAAAIPEAWATVWLKLILEARLQPGESVIIHAGASGIGSAAIQLCKNLGCNTFVTVGTQEKLAYCLNLGADNGAVRHETDWQKSAHRWRPNGVNVILDPVGASYLEDNLRTLSTDGRLVVMGLLGGRKAQIDLGRLLIKRLRIIGSTLRSRDDQMKNKLMEIVRNEVLKNLSSGLISSNIFKTISIHEAHLAHELLSNNTTTGKVVLLVK